MNATAKSAADGHVKPKILRVSIPRDGPDQVSDQVATRLLLRRRGGDRRCLASFASRSPRTDSQPGFENRRHRDISRSGSLPMEAPAVTALPRGCRAPHTPRLSKRAEHGCCRYGSARSWATVLLDE